MEYDTWGEVMNDREFCDNKCGSRCLYMITTPHVGFPCIEYICKVCKLPKEKCTFCKTGET